MRYDILGPLHVSDGNGIRSISAPKVKHLLTTLLIRANHVVPSETLVGELWVGNPPRSATAALHVYVSQLRKLLSGPGHGSGPSPLVTKSPGYLLRVAPGELDLHRFQRLLHEGRVASRAGRHDKVIAALGPALALCRGRVLSGPAEGPVSNGFLRWVDEARIESAELFAESSMALGRYQEMVGLLRSLLLEYPLHEVFYQQLIRCLAGAGRRAEALGTYHSARTTIRRELGLEPCRALRELHRTILRAEDEETTERVGMRLAG